MGWSWFMGLWVYGLEGFRAGLEQDKSVGGGGGGASKSMYQPADFLTAMSNSFVNDFSCTFCNERPCPEWVGGCE